MSAIQAIRSISNWLYWQIPVASGASSGPDKSIIRIANRLLPEPNIEKLREAAAARKQVISESKQRAKCENSEEYWAPTTYALASSTNDTTTPTSASKPSSSSKEKREGNAKESDTYENNEDNPIRWAFPMVTAMIAVATVRLHGGGPVHELNDHAGGSLALDIVNSPWSQCILAAATWYMIGLAIIDLVAIIGRKK